MRSSAGIVAGLFVAGFLAVNCGGNDSNGGGTAGSANLAGQGGEGNTGPGGGGKAGTAGSAMMVAGAAGMPAPVGCTKDADCGDAAKCVDSVCKKDDGEACSGADDCQNNCIDDVCTSKGDDGTACTTDDECAHTCIDGSCAPVSDVGGDCDVDLGGGGAGGDGAGGNASAGGNGAGGDASGPAQPHDCKAPLQCFSGKCLTPDGEACTDNIDCVNTCVNNVCQPKSTIDGACDDKSDCAVAALVCDETSAKCKLDLLQQCGADDQCKSQRCICSDANCSVRTCKNPPASCLCKWSPADSNACNVNSANLNAKVEDPQGCLNSDGKYCNKGQCVVNAGGACTQNCSSTPDDPNTPANEATCTNNGGPTGCNAGYHGTVTTQCAFQKAICSGACQCDLD